VKCCQGDEVLALYDRMHRLRTNEREKEKLGAVDLPRNRPLK